MVALPPRRGTSSLRRSLPQSLVAASTVGLVALALNGCSTNAGPAKAVKASSTGNSTTEPATAPTVGTLGSTATGTGSTLAVQPSVNGSVIKQARTLTISVQGQKVSPAPTRISLSRGQTLRLVITSDHADQVHAHGFEMEAALVPGRPTTLDLTGSQPGLYEVETHHPALTLLQVLVR